MIDSVEMDEVGTQGQGGRQNQDKERDTNPPRRDDRQGQDQDSKNRSKQDQPGQGKRQSQGEEEEN